MLKLIKILFLLLSVIILAGCQVDSDPKLVVLSKEPGRTNTGSIQLTFEVENQGEKPAYFVVAMIQALNANGDEIAYKEKGLGDIFPDEKKRETLEFLQLGGVMPDKFEIEMSYNIEINSINQYE
jgi:uncharacterized protein (TIGR02588 family)